MVISVDASHLNYSASLFNFLLISFCTELYIPESLATCILKFKPNERLDVCSSLHLFISDVVVVVLFFFLFRILRVSTDFQLGWFKTVRSHNVKNFLCMLVWMPGLHFKQAADKHFTNQYADFARSGFYHVWARTLSWTEATALILSTLFYTSGFVGSLWRSGLGATKKKKSTKDLKVQVWIYIYLYIRQR